MPATLPESPSPTSPSRTSLSPTATVHHAANGTGSGVVQPAPLRTAAAKTASSKPRSSWFSSKVTNFVGIDIGEQFVRVATLKAIDAAAGCYAWNNRQQFALPSTNGDELSVGWLQSLVTEIPERLPRCIDGETNVAAVALPITWTHYQTVVGHEIPEMRRRCSEMFAGSVFRSPAHVCHWPVVGVHHGKPSGDDQYVIAATAENTACQITDAVTSIGYTVQSILPHGVALAHAATELTGVDAQCVIWLSHSSALICVRHQTGVGLTRTIPSIPKRLLELEQSDRPLDAHAIRPYLTEVAREFRATARYAARADMNRVSKKPILIAGPLGEMQGVDEIIATLTKTPVAVWSYFGPQRPATLSKLDHVDPETVRRLDSSYAGALSLALAAVRGSSRGYGH